jgi:GxxExxY protein
MISTDGLGKSDTDFTDSTDSWLTALNEAQPHIQLMGDSTDIMIVSDRKVLYNSLPLLYHEDSYELIGICMDVHNQLHKGYSEVVYKDALSYEFNRLKIPFEREKQFQIRYKDIILPSYYYCDFVIKEKIVLEIKTQQNFSDGNLRQVLNYLAVTQLRLGLLVNFGKDSLEYRRVVL